MVPSMDTLVAAAAVTEEEENRRKMMASEGDNRDQNGARSLAVPTQEGQRDLGIPTQEGPRNLGFPSQEGPRNLGLPTQEGPRNLEVPTDEGPSPRSSDIPTQGAPSQTQKEAVEEEDIEMTEEPDDIRSEGSESPKSSSDSEDDDDNKVEGPFRVSEDDDHDQKPVVKLNLPDDIMPLLQEHNLEAIMVNEGWMLVRRKVYIDFFIEDQPYNSVEVLLHSVNMVGKIMFA